MVVWTQRTLLSRVKVKWEKRGTGKPVDCGKWYTTLPGPFSPSPSLFPFPLYLAYFANTNPAA